VPSSFIFSKWKITALDVGTLEFEKSVGTYLTNCGVKTKIHNVIFLLEETAYFSPLIGEKPSFWGTPFEEIEGDWKVTDGIRVIAAPGHTPGSQMVLVDTEKGVYCLAGDNAFYYENINKNIAVGHLYSRADWFSSMLKARQASDSILPSHDPLLFKTRPAVFP